MKLRYAYLTATCVSPLLSNPAVDCATESWLYMSDIIEDAGGQTPRDSGITADQHLMNYIIWKQLKAQGNVCALCVSKIGTD